MRECGKCSLCCNFLAVAELDKPANTWCQHCRPGNGGCSIYSTRPSICRTYSCGWLISESVGDEWYPLKSRMVLTLAPIDGVMTCTVTVDPQHPHVWTEPPYYAQLKRMASHGLRAKSPTDILIVQVRCDGRVWLLMDEDDIEITRLNYIVKFTGSGAPATVELFKSLEEANTRVAELI